MVRTLGRRRQAPGEVAGCSASSAARRLGKRGLRRTTLIGEA